MLEGQIQRLSQNIEYTHNWAIENLDFSMVATMGKIESASFYIPGVTGGFHMVVEKGTGNNYKTAINGPCTLEI